MLEVNTKRLIPQFIILLGIIVPACILVAIRSVTRPTEPWSVGALVGHGGAMLMVRFPKEPDRAIDYSEQIFVRYNAYNHGPETASRGLVGNPSTFPHPEYVDVQVEADLQEQIETLRRAWCAASPPRLPEPPDEPVFTVGVACYDLNSARSRTYYFPPPMKYRSH